MLDGAESTDKNGITDPTIATEESAAKMRTPSTSLAFRFSRESKRAQAFFHVKRSIIFRSVIGVSHTGKAQLNQNCYSYIF
jgi:hypothetical protein